MRESCTYGSVRGARGNLRPYRDRRECLALIGGAAAWPLAADAQKPAMPVIAFLSTVQVPPYLVQAFRQGLKEVGYIEADNVAFEYRASGSDYTRFRAIADDMVRRQVAMIFATGGTAAALAAKSATATIPIIIYMGGDPIQQGVVASLNRPGGNVTGLSWLGFALGAKRLELLRELVPDAKAIALLVNPNNPDSEFEVRDVQAAAGMLGRQLRILHAGAETEFEPVFAKLAEQSAGALVVASDVFFSGRRNLIVALATRHRVPAIYERRDFPEAGGLISYGHHRVDAYRQLGIYAGRILNGARPADLPVLTPTKFELVINLRTARMLGLTVPLTLQAAADEVIE